jgi:formyltetrahydrofolate hydrolase
MQNDKNEYVIARVFEPKFNEENLNVARYMQILAANIVKQTNNL